MQVEVKRPPISDDEELALRKRNEERAREAIARLGRKYVCHPVHAPQRAPAQEARSVLSRYWGAA